MSGGQRALRLGTRRSALALAQSGAVAAALTAATGRPVELVEVTTFGDVSRAALAQIGGTGVFVGALREALVSGQVDLAVHSLKDLPTAPARGVALAAVPEREDPRDALVARDGLTLAELPPGARIGSGSPRRAAQLAALGLGHEVVPIRGNVDTRLRLVTDGELDAVVLARAGLVRLGRADAVTEVLDPLQMLPAPGQGALALECRSDDAETAALCAALESAPTRLAVLAERSVLAALEAGCSAPVGALAEVGEGDDGVDELYLRALVAAPDGHVLRLPVTGPVPDAASAAALGRRLAADLLAAGAADLVPALSSALSPALASREPPAPPAPPLHPGASSTPLPDAPATHLPGMPGPLPGERV
ncbi:hydroxymethylbilane synthase [Motilibacter rhizosphaerae]|uniref:Porphobilinogen deaminase n=1 Tax=Motilibacter rhizosphaerae TaxID=598652 RepID=A0A4Q7NAE3_9ACTN|nr:hydroxymethylbilane synthase [Motilibacter rhizosphaerae]RZS79059.1 hydroxymethylbilane synthase [Motilibacter rhizosphaerae]